MPNHWRMPPRRSTPAALLNRPAAAPLDTPPNEAQKKSPPAQGQGEQENEPCRKPTTQRD